ncbi:TlpA family protein disulfide reductase [Sphingobacterium spiritivorum]|uniref:TlpA family protein disulfide reductase n=1 Tax=Sphingobacterium spiritivorum TaxID=258 RepID=UPI00191958FA|nr:TlpA disulfide reductase family protein [Sphingobacterium spiritivorum]QQT24765.1 TlpA family protein disulfide reductase [Sphingobacterium spiritivorum]
MIKKILTVIILSPLSICLRAQNVAPVHIRGELTAEKGTVRLFKVSKGRIVETANIIPAKNGKFGFLFYPEYEGIYVIGTGKEYLQNSNYRFYLKGGDQLDVTLTDTAYILNGDSNSKENIVLKQWFDFINPLFQKAIHFTRVHSTYLDYFPQQETIVAKSKSFFKGKATGNKTFDREMSDIMEMDLINYATSFVGSPRTVHPRPEEYSAFYNEIKIKELAADTRKIYNYPYGLQILSSLVWINMERDKVSDQGLTKALDYIPNDTLKGDHVLEYLAGIKDYKMYKAVTDRFGKYVLTGTQKQENVTLIAPLLTYERGTDGFEFNFPDQEDKQVSFVDFKGKVVLIDVWATWCGPCRTEFPYLKQLEKDIIGKPIQLISISVDDDKDKSKWLKMIRDEDMGGVQLFAGENDDFSKYYNITGIPRFLVFDKNGKIVTVDAPRPSNPKLKELLFSEAAR